MTTTEPIVVQFSFLYLFIGYFFSPNCIRDFYKVITILKLFFPEFPDIL